MKIICDIGGTHARFAHTQDDGPLCNIRKYRANDFPAFEAALTHYCDEVGIENPAPLLIATAAYSDGEAWRFVNNNKWVLRASDFELIMNDFEAATWGLINCPVDERELLKLGSSRNSNLPQCLIGPGTGLGLGYLIHLEGAHHHIQRTHGGHIPASALSDEHIAIIRHIRGEDGSLVVFENLVSGPGLYALNTAWRALNNLPEMDETLEGFFETLEHHEKKEPLRLFHEFFGLFASTVTITGHAYGGLYLTGGVLDRLAAQGLFDFKTFEKFFVLNGVESVRSDLAATKIVRITDPYLAMRGLLNAIDI